MKINLQFSVSCAQCPHNNVFNAHMMFPNEKYFANKIANAEAFFERAGWLKLPSGSWICDMHASKAKEAA